MVYEYCPELSPPEPPPATYLSRTWTTPSPALSLMRDHVPVRDEPARLGLLEARQAKSQALDCFRTRLDGSNADTNESSTIPELSLQPAQPQLQIPRNGLQRLPPCCEPCSVQDAMSPKHFPFLRLPTGPLRLSSNRFAGR